MNGRVVDAPSSTTAQRPTDERAEALEPILRLASRARMLSVVQRLAAHDFNDSLNSLTLNLELLARTIDADVPAEKKHETQQRCVTAMRQELKRMAAATGAALDASTERREPMARVSLADVIDRVAGGLRHRAQRQRVSLRFDPPAARIEVTGDTDELRLAVFNLALNAIEAMPDGGELTFDLRAEGKDAVLRVIDTGAGIPDTVERTMWERGFSTKPEGLGLGLHVVRDVAARHGGTVALERPGSGVIFAMRVPLIQ